MNRIIAFLVCFIMASDIHSQEESSKLVILKGLVYDSISKNPLPYTTVVNQSSKNATITNSDGYFELEIQSLSDTVYISYIGYTKKVLETPINSRYFKIGLNTSSVNIDAVDIYPDDNSYVYNLIAAVKEKQSQHIKDAKVYYQLKSFIAGNQVELVENFYNARIKGYDLLSLNLKVGRLGLKKNENLFFASLESSKPIQMHRLFNESYYFPHSSLEFSERKMKKKYTLEVEKVFVDENRDSIVVAYFEPKRSKSYHFSTRVWVNASDTSFIKIELEGKHLYEFPLVPVFHDDKLSDINLKITKTFEKVDGEMFFKHIDFNYDFDYTKGFGVSYRVNTEVVLFSYNYGQKFNLPITSIDDSKLTDYQKLSANPYNAFFWENNNELSMHDEGNENELFIQDEQVISNNPNSSKNYEDIADVLNYPIIKWSEARFQFTELDQKTIFIIGQPSYKFETPIFLDYNKYNDSIDVLIQPIFDVYKSYFRYEIDSITNCFFNMYFDLVEIESRRLKMKIKYSENSWESINEYYQLSQDKLQKKLSDFINEVQMGKNESSMKKWNDFIKVSLGIDNLATFKVY